MKSPSLYKIQAVVIFAFSLAFLPRLTGTTIDELSLLQQFRISSGKHEDKLKPQGKDDSCYPAKLNVRPKVIAVGQDLEALLGPLALNHQLNLRELPSTYLNSLPDAQLRTLLRQFNAIPVQLQWRTKTGATCNGKKRCSVFSLSRWRDSTALGALALTAGIQENSELLARMLAISPHATTAGLQGAGTAVLDEHTTANALVRLLSTVSQNTMADTATASKQIVQIYIEYWAGKSSSRLVLALTKLVVATTKLITQPDRSFSNMQKGILLGALLAGSLIHAQNLKTGDERSLWIVNSISNLVWASTTLLGCIPIAGNIIAGVAGTISIGAVIWAVVRNRIGSRDYSPSLREIEGHIEFSALGKATAQNNNSYMVDTLETLAWMRATIHINGVLD